MELNDLVYFIHDDYRKQTQEDITPPAPLVSQYVNAVESLFTVFTGHPLVRDGSIVIHEGYAAMPVLDELPIENLSYQVKRPTVLDMREEDLHVIQSLISHALATLPNQAQLARETYIGELSQANENQGRILTPFGKALTVSDVQELSLALHICEMSPEPRSFINMLSAESSQHESAYQRRIIAGIINIVDLYGTEIYENEEMD